MTVDGVLSRFVDDEVRSAIAESLDETLFVEAGAGTGKTSALVRRVLSLVRNGRAQLSEIAAITFTEASATELRERVGQEIERLFVEDPQEPWVVQAREQLDESAITTIHGFAMRILSDNALQAGLPLRFRVLDQVESALRFEAECAEFLDEFFDDRKDHALVTASVAIGITPTHLRSLLRVVQEMAGAKSTAGVSAQGELSIEQLSADVHELATKVADGIHEACAMRSLCTDELDNLFVRLVECEGFAVKGRACVDWLDELSWLMTLKPQKVSRTGKAGNWASQIADVRTALISVDEQRIEGLEILISAILESLAVRLLEVSRSWAAKRKKDGEINFSDLLVLTRDLVVESDVVRRSVRDRYRRILVDEFQDTDPLQLEIMLAIGREENSERQEPGRLFFVGDPRQSIYRFRGAQPEMYERSRRDAFADRTVELSTNFRSVPGVLSFVNHVFGTLFAGDDLIDDSFDELAASPVGSTLAAARESVSEESSVILLGGAIEGGTAKDRRAIEAEEIARAIAHMVGDGALVHGEDAVRPARFADVAILVPRRTGLFELEDALNRFGVPYRLQSASLIYNAADIRDLLSCLGALTSDADEPAVLAALRSSIFACGDDELLEFRRAGGEWRLDIAPTEMFGGSRVAEALQYLRSLKERRYQLGLFATVSTFIAERHVFELAIARQHPTDALRRLHFVLDQIRDFADRGGTSVAALLAFLELQKELRVRAPDLSPGSDEDDAVAIMTIHGAKGLEYPIVVVSELGATKQPQIGSRVLYSDTGRIELRVSKDRSTTGFADLAANESREDKQERLRLCYVAATRARDHLILSVFHQTAKSEGARSLAELVVMSVKDRPELWRSIDLEQEIRPIANRFNNHDRSTYLPVIASEDHFEEILTERANFAEGLLSRSSIAASELAKHEDAVDEVDPVKAAYRARARWRHQANDELASMSRRSEASAVGRAVHGVLQLMAYEDDENLDGLIDELSAREDVVERKDSIAALVRAALAAPTVAEGLSSPRSFREFPLTAVVDGRILEAVIDLCYEKDGEMVIVDYKTDTIDSPKDAEKIAERYRLQAGAYGLAMKEVLGVSVSRVVLVFLAMPTEAIEVEVTDLPGAIASARAALLELVEGVPLDLAGAL